ncbi:uncharacterized protein LOC117326706 [Pecten maximus]|uniref:uncharacterized protein LOC117326706 n=1 Tax=Pecten maximus TaxID=6579 RepID=UPI001458B0E2|nr:uncharacterized protein LOC117326706 [Pecten maximus]
MFTNAQCTSMAYQALAYKMVCGQPDTWNYHDIDAILQQGHILHCYFRDDLKLSNNVDNRIALYELPHSHEVGVFPSSITGPSSIVSAQNVQMTVAYDIDGIYEYESREIAASFDNVVTEFPVFISKTFSTDNVEAINMILTVGAFSMAIWRQSNENTIWLFDSHRRDPTGLVHAVSILETDSFDNGAALARSFDNANGLLEHITEIYGKNFYYNARLFNLDMGNSDSVPAAGNKSDEAQDNKEDSQDDITDTPLDEEKYPP